MKTSIQYINIILLFCSSTCFSQQLHHLTTAELIDRQWIDPSHANLFATIQVQDFQGRIKPIHTLSLELLRKFYGKNSFSYIDAKNQNQKLSPTQVFLGMQFRPDSWQLLECLKIHKSLVSELKKQITITKNGYTSFSQFFDFNGNYKINESVTLAYSKKPGKRNNFDKKIINLDERINILGVIFSGQFLKIFPKKNDPDQKWYAPSNNSIRLSKEDSLIYHKFTGTYMNKLEKGLITKNWTEANETALLIKGFQSQNAGNILLKNSKVDLEIWFNEHPIFFYCLIWYCIFGLALIILAFVKVFNTSNTKLITRCTTGLLIILCGIFGYQAFGIILRWYISGHAPWSNGYEAIIFISWISVLAGLIFSRKNLFAPSVSAILATCLLGIAHGSLMNPEITNLVPVLKSYWLLIHVAVITASYGFLALGSLLAFINLILESLNTFKKQEKVTLAINELTNINQLTSTLGLYLLTAGTFLGGIWANESWGRYWGWDPKETWALISIIIYSFVLHIRIIIPKNYSYTYNVCSLFAIGSIIMTFFGVNYYLSGLHSYAKGDSFPIPKWIPVIILVFILVSLFPIILKYLIKKPATELLQPATHETLDF